MFCWDYNLIYPKNEPELFSSDDKKKVFDHIDVKLRSFCSIFLPICIKRFELNQKY